MGKIGDLWVKLGVKNEDLRKGFAEAKSDVKDFESGASAMSTAVVAAWGAVTMAVMKFASDAIKLTQQWGDRWSIAMEGVKAAYGTFIRQLASGDGWDNLFTNMDTAFRKAQEVAAVLDEIFERKISFSYDEAQTNKYISEQQLIMRDASKSDEERMKAANNIIEAEKKLGDLKRGVWQDEARAMRDQFQIATNLNDEQTDFLVKNYNQNRDIINQARDYASALNDANAQVQEAQRLVARGGVGRTVGAQMLADAQAAKTALETQTAQEVKDIAQLVKQYDRSNDELVAGMAQAEVAVINIDTEVNRASMRATAMLGSLTEASQRAASASGSKVSIDTEVNTPQLADVDKIFAASERRAEQARSFWNEQMKGVVVDAEAMAAALDEAIAGMADPTVAAFTQMAQEANNLDITMKDMAESLANSIQSGIINAVDALAESLGDLDNADPSNVIKALLNPFADMAIQIGTMIMLTGSAIEALKASLVGFFGGGAVVAGAALVGIGVAMKAGLAAIGRGNSTSSNSYTSSNAADSTQSPTTETMEITVHLDGKLRGNDIYLSAKGAELNLAR